MQYFSVMFCKEEKDYERMKKNCLYTFLSSDNCYYTLQLNIYNNQCYNHDIHYLFTTLLAILLSSD